MRIVELLKGFKGDTRQQVDEAIRRPGSLIREAIRSELRFKSQWTDPKTHYEYGSQCPVGTHHLGYPEELAEIHVPSDMEFAARLAPILPSLGRFAVAGHLKAVLEAAKYDLTKYILHSFEGDVLGCYQFQVHESRVGAISAREEPVDDLVYPPTASASIELYWGTSRCLLPARC